MGGSGVQPGLSSAGKESGGVRGPTRTQFSRKGEWGDPGSNQDSVQQERRVEGSEVQPGLSSWRLGHTMRGYEDLKKEQIVFRNKRYFNDSIKTETVSCGVQSPSAWQTRACSAQLASPPLQPPRSSPATPPPHLPPLGPSDVQHTARGPTHVLTGAILPARPALWSASLLLSSSPTA